MQRGDELVLAAARHRREVAATSLGIRLRLIPRLRGGDVLIPVPVAAALHRPLEELIHRRLVTDPGERSVDVGHRACERHRRVGRAVSRDVCQATVGIGSQQRERARRHAERHLHLVQGRVGISDRDLVTTVGRER